MRNQQNVTWLAAAVLLATFIAAGAPDDAHAQSAAGADDRANAAAPREAQPAPGRRMSPYEQTAAQSLRESVRDLGNFFVAHVSSGHHASPFFADLNRWSLLITRNPKVLRLIEAGRDGQRDEVRRWIEQEIAETVAGMGERVEAVREDFAAKVALEKAGKRGGGRRSVSFNDGGPEDGYRYDVPFYEYERALILVYNGFYVLAELGGMDRDLLADWLAAPKAPMQHADLMDLWLVDRYYRQQPDAPGAEQYLAAYGDLNLSTRRYDLWSFSARGDKDVPAADRATLTLAGIPSDVPVDVDEAARIVRAFVETTREI